MSKIPTAGREYGEVILDIIDALERIENKMDQIREVIFLAQIDELIYDFYAKKASEEDV